jgi:hypothetical protein
MKKALFLAGLLTLGMFAAETSQYSYQNQQRAYDQAKGKGDTLFLFTYDLHRIHIERL